MFERVEEGRGDGVGKESGKKMLFILMYTVCLRGWKRDEGMG